MATLRCPVDETIFQSEKGWPGYAGHIDCPGPSCTELRGGPPEGGGMQQAAPPPGPPKTAPPPAKAKPDAAELQPKTHQGR